MISAGFFLVIIKDDEEDEDEGRSDLLLLFATGTPAEEEDEEEDEDEDEEDADDETGVVVGAEEEEEEEETPPATNFDADDVFGAEAALVGETSLELVSFTSGLREDVGGELTASPPAREAASSARLKPASGSSAIPSTASPLSSLASF